jgi:nicotinamidase-related amidase
MPKFSGNANPETTAILVVDMTNGFVAPGAPVYVDMGNRFATKLGAFLDVCREKGFRIIYTTHIFRADGADMDRNTRLATPPDAFLEGTPDVEIYPPCAMKPGDILVKKHFYSGFYCTDMDVILRSLGIGTVVITGVCTDVCCFATARDAFNYGYGVVMLADLNGSPGWPDIGFGALTPEQHHIAALNNLAVTGADVMTSEEFKAHIE